MEFPEHYDRTDIREFTLVPMIVRGVRWVIQDIHEWKGQAFSKKVSKNQSLAPKQISGDIVGNGENFLKNFHKYPTDQIMNAISEVLYHWLALEFNGYDSHKVFENLKRYLGEILKSEDGRKLMLSSRIFIGELEDCDSICIEEIENRVRAQANLKELFTYGTSGNSENPISFELLQKLGLTNKKRFFEGTNTEKLSQFDFVVMGLFDAIRREVIIADIRKRNKSIFQTRTKQSENLSERVDLISIQQGFIERASEIAQVNIEYYIGVLKLILALGKEHGYDAFSMNAGEYFEKVFSASSSNAENDMDLIHELSQAKVKIQMAFGTPQNVPDDLPDGVVRLKPVGATSA